MEVVFSSLKECVTTLLKLEYKAVMPKASKGLIHMNNDLAYVLFTHDLHQEVKIILSPDILQALKNGEELNYEELPIYSEILEDGTKELCLDFKREDSTVYDPYSQELDEISSIIAQKIDSYMTKFGQEESIKIMQQLNFSKTFISNIDIALQAGDVPSYSALEGIIRSVSFKFLFVKKRVAYFSSLYYLAVLIEKYKKHDLKIDLEKLKITFSKICINYN